MIVPHEGPGTWQSFLRRKDNIGLSIMEAKQKYLKEQMVFESYFQNLSTVSTVSTAAAGAAGGPAPSTGGGGFTPITDSNLVTAKNLWFSDQAAAEAEYGPIGEWNTTAVTNMDFLFFLTSFNEDISGWDVSNVTTMRNTFRLSPFNQDISGWDVSSVTSFNSMFDSAASFDQDLSSWDIANSVSDLGDMFTNSGLSRANYDAILIGWSSYTFTNNSINFGAAPTKYSGGDAANARAVLTNAPNNWTITDGGLYDPFAKQ